MLMTPNPIKPVIILEPATYKSSFAGDLNQPLRKGIAVRSAATRKMNSTYDSFMLPVKITMRKKINSRRTPAIGPQRTERMIIGSPTMVFCGKDPIMTS